MRSGITFSLPHRLEMEVAEKLINIIPCAQKVRFAKNGIDVTSADVRLARAYANREHIAVCGASLPKTVSHQSAVFNG